MNVYKGDCVGEEGLRGEDGWMETMPKRKRMKKGRSFKRDGNGKEEDVCAVMQKCAKVILSLSSLEMRVQF